MKPTLSQVFVLGLLGAVAMLALLFALVFRASRATIVESSERIRDQAAREVGDRVAGFLARAPERVRQFQAEISGGLVDARDPAALERTLFALLLSDDNLGELSLTYATATGYDEKGDVLLAPEPRGQISVARELSAEGAKLWSRHVYREDGRFVADRREFPAMTRAEMREQIGEIPDPTAHLTFQTPANRRRQANVVPSDLHWSQLDDALPEAQRRVEVSVQQAVADPAGRFLGVFRLGLLTRQLDRATHLRLTPEGMADPHRIFLCDSDGRLVTRLADSDHLEIVGEDLRVAPAGLPPEVTGALRTTMLGEVDEASPNASGQFHQGGREFLATFHALRGTQGWIVGVVAPRDFYFGRLAAMRMRMLAGALGIVVFLATTGALILRAVRRAQLRIVRQSLRMNRFEFSPAPTESAFRDVSEILESLEQAKTAMRAMGKYVPIDLVRRLYREKSEPVLGGEDHEISIMFTDIKDFTSLSEQLEPNRLAAALGRYLETLARIIQQETSGTIDKYIGDAIMAIWNAPEPVADHARMACRAALRCRDAGRELARTPEWAELPPFETRFGLHCDTALVGHFGAPDRMNYTAIGDAVNLASRLEGLNKVYGTSIIAGASIAAAAREHFDFRLLDLVAVKGKSQAVRIYELIGEKRALPPAILEYERAFEAYLARDFAAAISMLASHKDDAPSAVLLERCHRQLLDPPPPEWDGVYVAKEK
jgi:adenylate cyclase